MVKTRTAKKQEKFSLSQNTILYDFIFEKFFRKGNVVDWKTLKIEIEYTGNIWDYTNEKIENLETYKQNLKNHLDRMNMGNEEKIDLTYYQFIVGVFTEIYLDNYFGNGRTNKENFLKNLVDFVKEKKEKYMHFKNKSEGEIQGYLDEKKFFGNKLVYWMATGSGKTIVMILNALQYLHYNGKNVDNVVLITPNADLSEQHYRELQKYNFVDSRLKIHEITKLKKDGYTTKKDSHGKMVNDGTFDAVSRYKNSRNLILVDEGHKSMNDGEQKQIRDILGGKNWSFTLEYSATFEQALAKTDNNAKNPGFEDEEKMVKIQKYIGTQDEYSLATLVNYSFSRFNEDLYGKEVKIHNTKNENTSEMKNEILYQTLKILLVYTNQSKFYEENKRKYSDYNLEKPLIAIFGQKVGGKTTAGGDNEKDIDSEVVEFLKAIGKVLTFDDEVKEILKNILQKSDDASFDVGFLKDSAKNDEDNNVDIEKIIFMMKKYGFCLADNETEGNTKIKIYNIKNGDRELGLKVGQKEYFGLIYVGDTEKVIESIKNEENVEYKGDDIVTGSLYDGMNRDDKLAMIVGSQRFTTGWNNYRVSVMGLLNVGQGKGSTIIQVLGRGVRIKGRDYSLKREENNDNSILRNGQRLYIMGLNSQYLENFIETLRGEGENMANEDEYETIEIKVRKQIFDTSKLKVPSQKSDFKMQNERLEIGEKYTLVKNENNIYNLEKSENTQVEIDFARRIGKIIIDKRRYIRVETRNDSGKYVVTYEPENDKNVNMGNFFENMWGYVDRVKIYVQLVKVLEQKEYRYVMFPYGTENLEKFFQKILGSFEVYLNSEYLDGNNFKASFGSKNFAENIFIEMGEKYMRAYVKYVKGILASYNQEIVSLDNLQTEKLYQNYSIKIRKNKNDKIAQIKEIKKKIEKGDRIGDMDISRDARVYIENHIYEPLFTEEFVEKYGDISPIGLNEGEKTFVEDLKKFLEKNKYGKVTLLRNYPKTGVGAHLRDGGFYPDFLLWIEEENGRQYLNFIDPKGLKDRGVDNSKVAFAQEVKKIGVQNENFKINSFIVCVTRKEAILEIYKKTEGELEMDNVVFQEDEKYMEKIFTKILSE